MKLGLDIGNSTVKGTILTDNNKILQTLKFPSAVTTISDAKYLTFVDDSDKYFQIIESPLRHFDEIVAIGQKALEMPGYQEFDVDSTSYKADHPITTALLFGSLLNQANEDTTVTLAVSVPIVEAKTLGLVEDYKAKLTGEHVIRVFEKDETYDITITVKTALVMNEGQAGFLGMLDTTDKTFESSLFNMYVTLGEFENPVQSFEDFLIVDIGEGTTDLAVFRNKKFNPDFSYSVTKGYGNLLEEAMRNASREKLTIESRKDLQSVLESTNGRRLARKQLWESYVTPTKHAFVDTVVDTIIKTYGTRDYFDAIIFIGGGFSALTGYRLENDKIVMDDSRLFDELNAQLKQYNKTADLVFGIPQPYAQGINERGLVQVLSAVK